MAAITSGLIGVGLSATQLAIAESEKKKQKEAIRNFKPQELTNPNENIQISTLKSEQETESALSRFGTTVEALQRGGARTVLGGIPKVNDSNILLQNLISQDLERQDANRSVLIAQGEERIRAIRENREQLALQGLGQALNVANQNSQTAVRDLASSGRSLASGLSFGQGGSSGSTPFGSTSDIPTSTGFTPRDTSTLFSNGNSLLGG